MHIDSNRGADADLFEAIHLPGAEWQGLFFQRYERMVRMLLTRQLGTSEETDDLVSEVFLRFFERADQVRSAPGLRNYLYSIALYTARDGIRHRTRQRHAFATCARDVTDETRSTDDPRARAALRQLEAILQGMRSSDRQAYVLRQVVGLELDQVASALGVSLSTARRRVRAARQFVEKRASRSALLADYVRRGRAYSASSAASPEA